RFRAMATATRKLTEQLLSESQKQYLHELPLRADTERGNTRFCLLHSIPSDPLYGHYGETSERWPSEAESAGADVLFVGHTHKPFLRQIDGRTVCNPGSLGQPTHGKPEACYAVWEDGAIELKSFAYPVEETVRKIF